MPRDDVCDKPAMAAARALSRGRNPKLWPWLAGGVLLCALTWAGITYREIQVQSSRDEARVADAIVVFGAAEYAGRPSPVWRARLDHAYDLFQRGLAPTVITTGGSGEDPRYSEGGVGRAYLMGRGIAEKNLIAETQGDNTDESVARVATILRANGMRSCLAVSDGYHIFRIKKMLERQGFRVYGSPRPQSRSTSAKQRFSLISREVVSYTLWRLHIT